jgi:hypothetical protein
VCIKCTERTYKYPVVAKIRVSQRCSRQYVKISLGLKAKMTKKSAKMQIKPPTENGVRATVTYTTRLPAVHLTPTLNFSKASTPHIQELLLPVQPYPTVSSLIILMFCRQLHHVERTLASPVRKLFTTGVCLFWVIPCKPYVKL